MPRLRENGNLGVRHGRWGEDIACEFLRAKGYEIFERNVTPCDRDGRLEIDIVAYDRVNDTVVFVEVKQHGDHSPFERRLRSVDRRKLRNLLIVCNAWRRKNHWETGYRFDVVEVFGAPETRCTGIDHIENVRLFGRNGEYINWR